MKGFTVVMGCLLLLTLVARADQLKRVTFACQPEDAQVFLEVGTAAPYLLGRANQPVPLDLSLFEGRARISLTFRRPGWLDDTRVLQQENIQSRYFADRDRYPEAQQGPVRLTPKGDLASRLLQLRYYSWQWRHGLLVSFVILAGAGLVGSRRWLQLRRGHQRGQALDRLTLQLDPNDAYSGRLLGKYRLLERLGEGGMSRVYRAVDNEDLSSEAAIKILDAELAQEESSLKRFRREIDICKSLSHPNILTLYDYGEQDGIHYLVMERLVGQTLGKEIDKGIFSPARVAQVCGPLMEALAYLHQQGITHRDVKPDNVFLTQKEGGGRVKLMDFGISRGDKFTRATVTHMGLGTPAYMSPEQVEGEVSAATDQYAVGCIIYEMLSGAPPFTDDDAFALAFKHVGQMPDPLARRAQGVSDQLNGVVMRMLEKDQLRRFADMSQAKAALLEACQF